MESMKEKMSAMLDGELHGHEFDEVLQAIRRDPELQAIWQRYHIAGAALRGDLDTEYDQHSTRVLLSRIEQEPVVLGAVRWRKWVQAAGGFAIAASVAAVAVISLKTSEPPADGNDLLAGKPIAQGDYIRAGDTHWTGKTPTPGLERELNFYLVEHNQYSSVGNIRGMMDYGRVAGYDNVEQDEK